VHGLKHTNRLDNALIMRWKLRHLLYRKESGNEQVILVQNSHKEIESGCCEPKKQTVDDLKLNCKFVLLAGHLAKKRVLASPVNLFN
jgi:hypothetical protein